MENEEDKKVDTQTTGEAEKTNADNTNKADTKKQDNGEQQEKNNTDVAKAFGNEAEENKNEVEKGKKANSVAKTNEDGSITFKSQEELNGFIDRMYKKGVSAQKANAEQIQEDTEQNAEQGTDGNNEVQQENTVIDAERLRAEIALEMIDADVNAKKARKAARLVDVNKVSVNGVLDKAKLKTEIDEIIAEWPELKGEINTEEKKGVIFGGSQGDMSSNSEDAEISKIFGNSKVD